MAGLSPALDVQGPCSLVSTLVVGSARPCLTTYGRLARQCFTSYGQLAPVPHKLWLTLAPGMY